LSSKAACSAECERQAVSFAKAFNRLNAYALDAASPLRAFPQRAAAWRALATKPPLPEEINVRRMLAEDAIRNRKAEEALKHYELALEQYPTWPQGWFNAALIAGELGYYAEAVESMQAYLDLVPDASDAQSARDQLGIWRYKAGEHKLESNETR
jgi:tetratricopeptide (TPR) repeat protein